VLQRLALALVAVAAGGWLALELRSERLEAAAYRLVPTDLSPPPPEDLERANRLFDRARRHNPGTRPVLRQAALLVLGRRHREAARLLEEAVRREPENADAWSLLASATTPFDPARAAAALLRVRALSPPVRAPAE